MKLPNEISIALGLALGLEGQVSSWKKKLRRWVEAAYDASEDAKKQNKVDEDATA